MKRVVIASGGTGGHIFPALAVAEAMKRHFPQVQLLFIGGDKGPEADLARESGLDFQGLPARGVLGKGLGKSPGTVWWLVKSFVQCRGLYRRFDPELVIGFGSYASFVPVFLACLQKRITAIHEQNSGPGVSNKMLGKRVAKIFLSFADEKHMFDQKKVMISGNPVRPELIDAASRAAKNYGNNQTGKNVLVLGGSQGARAINEAILKALPGLKMHDVRLRHQTGARDVEKTRQAYADAAMDPEQVCGFIQDMAEAYAWSDLVVSRAGASTVAELMTVGRPSVLIPFPYATGRHQLTNARELEKQGAAMVLDQSYLDAVDLGKVITDLLAAPDQLLDMGRAARGLGRPDAASCIVEELERLHQEHKGRSLLV
ncbi:MAG: undecaprenyldiphospho-muramoylpentapeptide beta-N-acetylglucosaminyltransferase [Desulfohalobiaceae bacterium]|nr:undecaprenyldiphospho-muramoylpentapeptide beta-N-acetylglucosaminyltransferase [Desulfohalobiaceae bacterium]